MENQRAMLVWIMIIATIISIYFLGKKYKRFFFSLGSGEVVAKSFGKLGEIVCYYVTRDSMAKIEANMLTLRQKIDVIQDPFDKTRADNKYTEIQGFLRTKVKVAGGILRRFNLFTLSLWNPVITLHAVDKGNLKDKSGLLVTHYRFIDSPNAEVKGVDVSGPDEKGTFPITARFQLALMLFVDFDKIFIEERDTARQITDQIISGANLLCSGHDSDELEKRKFSPELILKVVMQFLSYGMIVSDITMPDFNLDESPKMKEASLSQALAGVEKDTEEVRAKTAVIKASGRAEAAKVEGAARAEVIGMVVGKLKEVHQDVARLLVAPSNPMAGVPTGGQYYTLSGSGKNDGPEVFVDAAEKKPENKKEDKETKPAKK